MITRRELLSKAAASSLLIITGCNQTSPTPAPQASIKGGAAAITRLNVFVHGLAVMEIAPSSSPADQGITLTFPNFTPGGQDNHIYKYGSVTKPSDKPGLPQFDATYPYYLKGVTPGIRPTVQDFGEPGGNIGADYTPDINIMLPKTTSVNGAGQRKFVLPWPEKLFPLNLMERSDGKSLCAITPKPPNGEPLWLTTTYLLTYTVPSGQTPKITRNSVDVGWAPASSLIPECPNLHIYAEPEVPVKSSHAVHAFSTLMGLLANAAGTTMDKYYKFNDYGAATPPAKVRRIPNATIPFGVSPSPDLGQLADKKGGELANCVGAIIMG